MDSENILLLGGLGLVAFLLYGTAQAAANVFGPSSAGAPDTGSWLSNLIPSGITSITGGASAIATAPQAFNCGDAYASSQMTPYGLGEITWPDNYVVACAGGVTVGMLRASGASMEQISNFIAGSECGCAAAQQQGLTIKNNLIQTPAAKSMLMQTPAGTVTTGGVSGVAMVPHGRRHAYYVRQASGWPAGQFPRGW